jgi:NAD(P)-dependent dehydrogenase (short-subunit alcohol dehydrogenase family)
MRRLGRAEEIKGVAILLASAASGFMTGSTIVMDGGQTIR